MDLNDMNILKAKIYDYIDSLNMAHNDIVINNVRTMREDNTLICSALGKKYTMKSLNSSGGKIYAFI